MLQSRESALFRNLKSFRNSALGLVDLEAQEVSLQKRARNAACCARFREKRKQKVRSLRENAPRPLFRAVAHFPPSAPRPPH